MNILKSIARRELKVTNRKLAKESEPIDSQFINYLMKDGKKQLATRILQEAMDKLSIQYKSDPKAILQDAILKAAPLIKIKSSKRGGKNVLMPIALNQRQRQRIGIEWIVGEVNKSTRPSVGLRIANQVMGILQGTSSLLQKRSLVHKQALANKSNLILKDRQV